MILLGSILSALNPPQSAKYNLYVFGKNQGYSHNTQLSISWVQLKPILEVYEFKYYFIMADGSDYHKRNNHKPKFQQIIQAFLNLGVVRFTAMKYNISKGNQVWIPVKYKDFDGIFNLLEAVELMQPEQEFMFYDEYENLYKIFREQ
jgi:hypothetical protein